MLKQFKKFADWVNSKRRGREFDFEKMVYREAERETITSVLEVGCNLRPILVKRRGRALHGLDPDPKINPTEAARIFDRFYNTSIEDFQADQKYDLIVLDMVMEHLKDNAIVFERLQAILNPGGMILIHIPNNLHPFSLINRVVSHDLKIKILKTLRPWAEVGVITGWKSYYDHCNIRGMKKLINGHQLVLKKAYTDYNASDYFAFFPPLFLLVVLYEEIVRLLGLRLFCAYLGLQIENPSKSRQP